MNNIKYLKQIVGIPLLLILMLNVRCQELSEKDIVGFGCGFEGSQTKPIEQSMKLLASCNTAALRENLQSRSAAKQYFAVIALSKLDSIGTIDLSADELEIIAQLHKSNRLIAFCSGCTVQYESNFFNALYRKGEIYQTSNYWISQLLEDRNYCLEE